MATFLDQTFSRHSQFIPDQVSNTSLSLPTAFVALLATPNLLDKGPLGSATLVMPTTDPDGNPISDGMEMSISFGDAITNLTLVGTFRTPPPMSASAGQVLNFRYSINTNSWWNA